jgi:hypothetical protein
MTTIYEGPPQFPSGWQAIAPSDFRVEYVYGLYSGYYDPDPWIEATLLYVGKTASPCERFKKHRQMKQWWRRVDHVKLLRVEVEPHPYCNLMTCRALRFEKSMIEDMLPTQNLDGPPNLPARLAVRV